MTFNEKCDKFKKNTEEEPNIFKKVYRTIFLNEQIEKYRKEEDSFLMDQTQKKERPKEHGLTKKIIKEEQ